MSRSGLHNASVDAVEVDQCDPVFDGYFRVNRYTLRHKLHAGGISAPLVREVFERGHVAALLPIDLRREEVVLIEQFRPGAYAAGWPAWLIECVAGVIETDETPEGVARRECEEETGTIVGRMELICRYLTSPGACSETHHLYVGEVDSRSAKGVHGVVGEGEDILVHRCRFDDAFAQLADGAIVNSKTIIALQWLQMNLDDLRQRWLAHP
jgi:ADP-ribose pyrophosphatase